MPFPNFEQSFRDRLSQRWLCDSPIPVSADELTRLTTEFGELPTTYETFLKICGGGAIGTMFDEYSWMPDSRQDRNTEYRLVASEHEVTVPDNGFVFLDYIGDYFWGFDVGDDDNPPVWMFDLQGIKEICSNLDDFLLSWEQL